MNKLYEMNYAGCHMRVGSLEVVGDLKGKGVKAIKKSVEALQAEQRSFSMQQQDYWSALASDGIITPVEKKQLYKEFLQIEQTYATLENEAIKQNLQGTTYFRDYRDAYNDLKNYLYSTITLFNDMNGDTVIDDRAEFDRQFSVYYSTEKFTTLALATGIMGNLSFRVLENLDEPGEEGEIGLYRGTIYQYTGGQWLPVGLEGYMGVKDELPNASLNQYFMAGSDFTVLQNLLINEEQLLVNNNEELYINQEFTEGFIYYWNGLSWTKVRNTSDYRYVVAMVDLVSITGQLPGVFQEAIDRATENLISHLPAYLGPLQSFPESGIEGDWFVYAGPNLGSRINSDIYAWENGDWVHYDPTDPTKSDKYMQALDDILALNNAGSQRFSVVFANAFWAHSVTTDKLSTRTLYLRQGGYIQSDVTHYDPNRSGLRIDNNGNIDANGNTHIGGNCNIDGTGTIGAGMKILGDVDVTGEINTSKNVNISGNCNITGTGTIGAGMKILGAVDISGKIDTNELVHIGGPCTIDGTTIIRTAGGSQVLVVDASGGTFSGNLNAAGGTFTGNISTNGSIDVGGNMNINGRSTVNGLSILGSLGCEEIKGLKIYNGNSLYIGTSVTMIGLVRHCGSKTAILDCIIGHASRLNEFSRLPEYIDVNNSIYEIIKGSCTVRYGGNNATLTGELVMIQFIWENGALRLDGGYIFLRSGSTVYKMFVSNDSCIFYQCTPSPNGSYTIGGSSTNLGNVSEASMVLG